MSILAASYNISYNQIYSALSSKNRNGTINFQGYGINEISSRAVTTSSFITLDQWKNLSVDLSRLYKHINNVEWPYLTTVLSTAPGSIINDSISTNILAAINPLISKKFQVHPSQLSTSTVFSTTSTNNTWVGPLESKVSVTWASPEEVYYFFNSGGTIEFIPSHQNDVGNSKGQNWKDFLSTVTSNYIYRRSNYISSSPYSVSITGSSSTQYILSAAKISNGIEFTAQFINTDSQAAELTVKNNLVLKRSVDAVVGTFPTLMFLTNLDGSPSRTYTFLKKKINLTILGLANPFEFYPNTQSSSKTFTISNIGNLPVNITEISFSNEGNITPIVNYLGGTWGDFPNASVILSPGNSLDFTLAFTGSTVGQFSNNIIIKSDSDDGDYYFNIRQIVSRDKDFIVNPSEVIKTINNYGESYIESINLLTTQPLVPEYEVEFSGSTAYSIFSLNTNSVEVLFDANEINNVNGVYTATLFLTSAGAENLVNFNTTVDITTTNTNLASWVSAASPDNSIIGISLDVINDRHYLTIGIGLGADSSSYYNNETGYQFADVENLGYKGTFSSQPYTFWNTVYRIPLESNPKTYYSKDYEVKNSDIDYGYYFGSEGQDGSMFIVQDDGYHNIFITLNSLREIPGDQNLANTLKNLTRAFYYYSSIDIGSRYYQLSSAINNGSQTYYFKGFDSTGEVITTIVDIP